MDLEEFKKRLSKYSRNDIIFTGHTKIRAMLRNIDLEKVKDNIINPEKLAYVTKEETTHNKEKFECYFAYSNNYCHKYVLALNSKVIIVTIIVINRDWQRTIKKRTLMMFSSHQRKQFPIMIKPLLSRKYPAVFCNQFLFI